MGDLHKDFEIIRDYYDEGRFLYKKDRITIYPRVTVLVGCNGAGKSTLLRQIKRQLDKDDIYYYSYDNSNDGRFAKDKALQSDDFSTLSALCFSSEGEETIVKMNNVAMEIGNYVRTNNQNQLWILLDGIDSGISIDNILDYKDLFNAVIEDCKHKEVYIVITANSYEMCKDENCFDVQNGVYRSFVNYDDYKKFILDSSKFKRKSLEG